MPRLARGLALATAALGGLLQTAPAEGQETTRVSVDSSGAEGNDDSLLPAISADGQIVAFGSYASNLVAGDTNGFSDVFVHDRLSGLTERVSVDSSGAEGNGYSVDPSLSANGQIVAFHSFASNLVPGDTNANVDSFVHDRMTGITERVSVDSSGAQGNSYSDSPSISADGQIVAFYSYASNLVAGDTDGHIDIFVHDRSTGITERVSVDSSGTEGNGESYVPSISADGQIVAFYSFATNFGTAGTYGILRVFVHDRSTGITEQVSVDSSGAEGNSYSVNSAISADGQLVAFWSYASNLVAGDANGTPDVFVHDRSIGRTERVSEDSSGAEGNGSSWYPSISADGQIVAFESNASNLVSGDTNLRADVFVHERGALDDAAWTNYGSGFPGTYGVPSFTSRADPVLGTTITLDLANSSGMYTVGLVLVGAQEVLIPTNKGGDLLVVPVFTTAIVLAPNGTSIDGDISADPAFSGLEVFMQAIEVDSGAAKGVSFTAGLKLVLGY